MKYKLIKNPNNRTSYANIILGNRGIKSPEKYVSLDDSHLIPYNELSNIKKAVECLMGHIERGSTIGILIDSDCDGYCSASMLYMYLAEIYNKEKIRCYHHEGKGHGLSKDVQIDESEIDLLFIPDGGSNDVEQCGLLKANDIDVIVLDHHDIEKDNKNAIVVNPKNCSYKNKFLSGGAVVYKFLQALDDEGWVELSGKYIDLASISIISDSMSIHEYENKRLIDIGLSSIKNEFIKALMQKQAYSLGEKVDNIDIISFQFYIIPLINALIRVGSMEEKAMMFEAFIGSQKTYDYKKRGQEDIVQEATIDKMARTCYNAKAKQKRIIDKQLVILEDAIKEYSWHEHKIMFVKADEDLNKNMTGLVAMKLASKYNKPCLLLRENKRFNSFSGSARSIDCDLGSLKEFLNKTGYFSFLQGHDSAFGVGIDKGKIRPAIKHINEELKDFDFTNTHLVDFEFGFNEINFDIIEDINRVEPHYGNGIKQCLVLIKNVVLNPHDIEVLGKKEDTVKFSNGNGITFIEFRCGDDSILKETHGDINDVTLNIIGKPGFNIYNGIETPQIIIEDLEIVEDSTKEDEEEYSW